MSLSKKLQHLKSGDAFVLEKSTHAFTISFVDKAVDGKYKVKDEILVYDSGKRMSFYNFTNTDRSYYPSDWFEEPWFYSKTHVLSKKEKKQLINKIFEYDLRTIE